MSLQVLHGGSAGRTESDFNAMSGPNFAAEADLSWSAWARFGKIDENNYDIKKSSEFQSPSSLKKKQSLSANQNQLSRFLGGLKCKPGIPVVWPATNFGGVQ